MVVVVLGSGAKGQVKAFPASTDENLRFIHRFMTDLRSMSMVISRSMKEYSLDH